MVFSSITFLFFFLPLVVVLYHVAPRPARNAILLIASLLFYLWGAGVFVLLLLAAIVTNYIVGFVVQTAHERGNRLLAGICITISIITSLVILGWFKYANFFVDALNQFGGYLGTAELAWSHIVLPIGISFYTFQSMSYVIDVARGKANAMRNPIDFALYVSFFPQLIAGPIVRFHEIDRQIRRRSERWDDFCEGTIRFAWGLAKKVVIADAAGAIQVRAFDIPIEDLTTEAAWIGLFAFTVQLYFDFSGYSDMAIGLGRMFGFKLPENFRRPYASLSFTDFWRRWHITLSTWFRDYLFFPMGGSKGSTAKVVFNLAVLFVLVGIWHGAGWTFLIWGAYNALLMIWERLTKRNFTDPEAVSSPLRRRIITVFMLMMGWPIFMCPTVASALQYYARLFDFEFHGTGALGPWLAPENVILMILGGLTVFLPHDFYGGLWITRSNSRSARLARAGLLLIVFPWTLMLIISGTFSPFIYFQF
ncbi:MAG: membrane-bound O-acyltransferase family protein [Phycisphaerae bacterium]|nr:membrane-bound O-acyltransferase family protein [Phycisphaerae bacterium]|tara:strand:+ start:91 stop:1524 length:1434 start_codon:yes stop_codon:yes gene_type:complete